VFLIVLVVELLVLLWIGIECPEVTLPLFNLYTFGSFAWRVGLGRGLRVRLLLLRRLLLCGLDFLVDLLYLLLHLLHQFLKLITTIPTQF
jgi:hypothetical protein